MSVRIYELTPAEALVSLGTSEHGLTAAEAASRRLTVGTNELRARHRHPWVRQLLRQFTIVFRALRVAPE